MAATAAQRLGLAPRFAQRDRTRFPGAGRSHRDEEPAEPVLHITRGARRDQRPDLHPVRLAWLVAHQAGSPGLMQPLRGQSSEAPDVGQRLADPLAQLQSPYGPTSLGADRALYRAEHLQKRADTRTPWRPRVPATWREAQAVLAQAEPQTMAPLTEESCAQVVPSP